MSAVRIALLIGAIPIIVGVIYLVLQELNGTQSTVDPAGVLLLPMLRFERRHRSAPPCASSMRSLLR